MQDFKFRCIQGVIYLGVKRVNILVQVSSQTSTEKHKISLSLSLFLSLSLSLSQRIWLPTNTQQYFNWFRLMACQLFMVIHAKFYKYTRSLCHGYTWRKWIRWPVSKSAGEHPFITIAPRSTLARNGSTWLESYLWVK